MEQILNSSQVREILSNRRGKRTILFPAKTLDNWCASGALTPATAGNGTGRHRVFRVLPDVLAIAAGRGLRANGFNFDVAAAVMRTISTFTEEQILQAFSEGRTCMSFFGTHVMPRLCRPDRVYAAIAEFEENNDTALHPSALDLKRLYDNILRTIDDDSTPKRKRTTTTN